jgi:hypothetical protein
LGKLVDDLGGLRGRIRIHGHREVRRTARATLWLAAVSTWLADAVHRSICLAQGDLQGEER